MPTLTEIVRDFWPVLEVLGADARAAAFAERYAETGTPIAYDDAVRLAFGLMAFRLPFTGEDREPGGGVGTVRAHEMLGVWSLRDGNISRLIEESLSDPVAFQALQGVLHGLRATGETIPGDLSEWALDVADGTRERPTTGPGRSRYTNQVRDAVIVRAVGALVDAGLTATRNEASEPLSACDAVARALDAHEKKLSYAAVVRIWSRRKNVTELVSVMPGGSRRC